MSAAKLVLPGELDPPEERLLGHDQLEAHVVELARAHGKPSLAVRARPLLSTFVETKKGIERVYRTLAGRPRQKPDLTPAEEWLLDNAHVIRDQLREIEDDLPPGYLSKLPRLTAGPHAQYPRVYALALDYIAHTDGRVDLEALVEYVTSYQSVGPLGIGELWAVPIMLRLGLAQRVHRLADQEIARGADRARAHAWSERVLGAGPYHSTDVAAAVADLANDGRLTAAFVVQLLRCLREHDTVAPALHWIHERCAEVGTTPEELTRLEHLRQAESQVSIGNAITSMRAISALDWARFFERTSVVEHILRGDPAGAYALTDAASRDRYRHAVEDIALRSSLDEKSVAEAAVSRSSAAESQGVARHVGYYLVDRGRRELERVAGYRPPAGERIRRAMTSHPAAFYLGGIAFVSALLVAGLVWVAHGLDSASTPRLVFLGLALAIPASEIALTLANWFVTAALAPRLLAKFAFEDGIPAEHAALVVVPALIGREADVRELLEDIEVRALANPEDNLTFALLTDFPDADVEEKPGEAALLDAARRGIAELNEREPHGRKDRYVLLHRRRRYNAAERRWMGWERKRGKLEELNRLLRGELDGSFEVITTDPENLRRVRYVLTLDADTQLPRGVARKLCATMGHPLNRPVLDATGTRVVRGYGVIQPRVGTTLASTAQSIFARVYGGRAGVDPYTTAVSDVYQDLFAEGVYCGKAMYDVDAFEAALADRVPDNRLLSHDLFEGLHARTALATDIELLDDQPSGYTVHAGRQHRWVRGDWQLASWLLPWVPKRGGGHMRNDLSLVARWKIFDNLRRSLLAPSLVALLVFGWIVLPEMAATWTALAVLVLATPLVGRLATALARPDDGRWSSAFFSVLWGDVRANAFQAALAITLVFDQAVLMIDAIARTFYRLIVRRSLLEWTTASDAERRAKKASRIPRRMLFDAIATLPIAIVVGWLAPSSLAFAVPLLLAWAAAPFVADWVSRPIPPRERPLSNADRILLRRVARKTWRFFDTFVTAEDHWLPPDNFQEAPKGEIAHRTSPTNIGLYLLSTVAARDFGYIGLGELCDRLENTFETLDGLEMHAGHILNWYDTSTLKPLAPRYVSTVDSGNLAAHLWAIAQGCREFGAQPIVTAQVLQASHDAVELFREAQAEEKEDASAAGAIPAKDVEAFASTLVRSLAAPPTTLTGWLRTLDDLARRGEPLAAWDARRAGIPHDGPSYWIDRAVRGVREALAELRRLAPWCEMLDAMPRVLKAGALEAPSRALAVELETCPGPRAVSAHASRATPKVDALEAAIRTAELDANDRAEALAWIATVRAEVASAAEYALSVVHRLEAIAARATELADGMHFRMLYDANRKLFAIGYDVGAGRLDGSYYDLLASEARLASLVAIAKGDVPQEHWFRLGRQLVLAADRRALLSWSGSMFEYLMPLLVTKSYDHTLLDETYGAVVRRQRQYGAQHSLPWGVSESAYNMLDMRLVYQYRAFGVPGLGLRPGLADELVVAPYASVLAALVRPDLASKNLRALAKEGLDGPYGLYDAIDYTPTHVPAGRRGVVVKVVMAHHQGMSLVAIDNVLNGDPMQRRFHLDARVKATELLLQERIPAVTPVTEAGVAESVTAAPPPDTHVDIEHVSAPASPHPRVHLLAHGEFSVMITAAGSGWTMWKGLDVTRFRDDAAIDAWGTFCYVRDVDSGAYWSTAYQPTRKRADSYDAAFAADTVTIHRRDGDIETLTEIVVSPEHPADVRRVTIQNHASTPRRIELTTYAEVVLAHRGADVAHPVFSNMFVETERPEGHDAVLATRRPRSPDDPSPWAVAVMAVEEGHVGPLEVETSRARFVGRGRTIEAPYAMEVRTPLSGATGTVLDPVLCLRRVLEIPPGGKARVAFTTALASSREAAIELADIFREARAVTRTFELAWTDARVELRHLGISAAQAQRFQRLASAILFPTRGLSAPPDVLARNTLGKEALWKYGISGDLPILLIRLDDSESGDLVREVLLAHEFWRLNGLSVDLVLLNEEPSSYLQPVHTETMTILGSSPAHAYVDQRGGVFVRRADPMPPADRTALQAAARVVLSAKQGSLARQLRRGLESKPAQPERSIVRPSVRIEANGQPARAASELRTDVAKLLFWNGIGGFTPDGREYVIVIDATTRTPAPWCNVIAGPRAGFLVSESGASYTWVDNSQTHRLTPWSNDPVSDPSGEAFYLRDEDDGSIWSATPRPAGGHAAYRVRHGQGYTTFEHTRSALSHELTAFVARDATVKVWRLRLTNGNARPRNLSIYGYVEWVLGSVRSASCFATQTEIDASHGVAIARNTSSRFPERVAFFTASAPLRSSTCDRIEFLGRSGSRREPAALTRPTLAGTQGAGLDPCAALQVAITIAPGETKDIVFVLGEGANHDEAIALAEKHRDPETAQRTLDAVIQDWDELLGAVQVSTPEPAFDLLVNRWLLYQAVSCRIWARSAFYQSGGAYGFRDQLQDVLAAIHAAPAIAREQIVRSAARQFREGDVQHWWHPETGQGVRTRYADDLVWLPYVVARYIEATGDAAILDERIPFLESRPIEPTEHEVFGVPSVGDDPQPLYEHCVRALDHASTQGRHGLPKMGGGDWNDGMNRVGEKGEGESVWMAWFLAATLRMFVPIASGRGDRDRAGRCARDAARLAEAIEANAWDGAWYRRAYFDDGAPLGSKESDECTIDAIAQSWAVISGVGDPMRARRAMRSTEEQLVKKDAGMILLFTPPFVHPKHDPGYICAYPAGLRENGGQYTHGILWTVLAETMLGEGDRAGELFRMLTPIHHTSTPERVERYRVEPYVVAADVYSASGHVGRGGWTWYTGSAAWMYRIALESMLGIVRRGSSLAITPCIPSTWPRYSVVYRAGSSRYRITVENPGGLSCGVARIRIDGSTASSPSIPLRDDGRDHEVRVVLRPPTEIADSNADIEGGRTSCNP